MAVRAETDARALGIAERREPPSARLELDSDPRMLRQSLAVLDGALRGLEDEAARRVRLLVTELVARSAEARHLPRGSIELEIDICPSRVRLEVSGAGLLAPSQKGGNDRRAEALFPYWALDGLADRWALDRRAPGPALWLEVRRGQIE